MTPSPRNLRPFFFLFAGMVAWWLAPAAFRRVVYRVAYEFEAPSFVLSSRVADLARYWEMRSRDKDDLIRAGRDMSRGLAAIEFDVSRNAALKEENSRLEKLLGLPERPDFRTVPARVAQRRLGMWWQQIVLRRGEDSGVRIGCPVVSADGVVGRVREVFYDTCVVELVSSPSFRISAKIAGTENSAVTYQGAGALPFRPVSGVIRDIPAGCVFPSEAEISDDGDSAGTRPFEVVTSGLGGIFPAGLKIGTLAGTPVLQPGGVFLESRVELSQSLASLEEAAILVPVNPDVLETVVSFREPSGGDSGK